MYFTRFFTSIYSTTHSALHSLTGLSRVHSHIYSLTGAIPHVVQFTALRFYYSQRNEPTSIIARSVRAITVTLSKLGHHLVHELGRNPPQGDVRSPDDRMLCVVALETLACFARQYVREFEAYFVDPKCKHKCFSQIHLSKPETDAPPFFAFPVTTPNKRFQSLRAQLYQASESTLRQLCNNVSDTALIENSRVAPEWVCNPFLSDSIVFNENNIASIVTEVSLDTYSNTLMPFELSQTKTF